MASSTIRKAIGVVKDQTSISIAKVVGNVAPDLEVLVVKATGHDNEPAEEKYIREILNLTFHSKSYVNACICIISKRLSKTHDWIVALKALMLIHRLLVDGDPSFGQEMIFATRNGTRVLNMSDFHDEAHSNSWEHSGFVKAYAMYLTRKLEFMAFEQYVISYNNSSHFEDMYKDFNGDLNESVRENDRKDGMKIEKVLERLHHLLRVLDRVLSCRPTGNAKNTRMVLIALDLVLEESFRVYADACEMLEVLLERFSQMEYDIGVKAYDQSVYAAKMSNELVGLYNWCKDIGVTSTLEVPDMQKITDELLGGLEIFLRERKSVFNNFEKNNKGSETLPNMNEINALPPPESNNPQPPLATMPPPMPPVATEDLLNLKDDAMSADLHGNKLALSLFSVPPNMAADGSWEVFSSNGDWEVALVESAGNLSKQNVKMAGGLDSLLLNSMYDQGVVRQHMDNNQLSVGSCSSVVRPATPMLALPAPDGTLQSVGPEDPFAASLTVAPPLYVQIADMEKKQHLLLQEQEVWQQYGRNGMQGQGALAKINAGDTGYCGGVGQQNRYYYTLF